MKYVVTGNWFDEDSDKFPLDKLADVELSENHDSDADSVYTLTLDNGNTIECDYFRIVKE